MTTDATYVDQETDQQLLREIRDLVKQLVLEYMSAHEPKLPEADSLPPDELAPLPLGYGANGYTAPTPVQAAPYAPNAYVPPVPASQWVCPIHGQVKEVPAGISQRTGQPYNSFKACPVRDCNQKPPR